MRQKAKAPPMPPANITEIFMAAAESKDGSTIPPKAKQPNRNFQTGGTDRLIYSNTPTSNDSGIYATGPLIAR